MVKVNESNFNMLDETVLGYKQIFAILIRRRFWLFGGLGGTLAIAIALTLMTKHTYGSYMALLLEPKYQQKREKLDNQFVDSDFDIDYATQLKVMKSSLLLQQAVDLLRPQYPNISVDEIKKSLIYLDRQKEYKESINSKVYTKIVLVGYIDSDRIKSQNVLKALLTVYQVYSIKQQKEGISNGIEFIAHQLPKVQASVDQSEAKVEQFRRNHNLIDPRQQAIAITKTLNATEQERQATHTQYKDAQATEVALQQQIRRSPQNALISSRLSQSPRYQTLLNDFQNTELALAQLHAVFKNDDPRVENLVEQGQSQQELLQNEVKRVLGSEAAQLKITGGSLLAQGQFGGIDQNLTKQLMEVQTSLRVLSAHEQSWVQTQQKLREELNQLPPLLSDYEQIVPQVQINRDQLEQMLKARQDLKLDLVRQQFSPQTFIEPGIGSKLDPSLLSVDPILGLQLAPSLKRNLLLGAVLGLMLGGFAAFGREIIEDVVYSPNELEKQVALPLLGMTPVLPQSKASEPIFRLPFGQPPVLAPWTVQVIYWPAAWESLDLIYKNIQLHSGSSFKSLMLTSAVAGEGKSTLALILALSATRLNQRVLLIDANLRCPSLHKQLNLPNEQGLSTLLTTDAAVPKLSKIESSGSYIDVLTAGPISADPARLLSSQRMRELMAAFEQSYDLVLLDTPPVVGLVDSTIAASFCGGVMLVTRIGKVTRAKLLQATAMLSKSNLIGVVANGVSSDINRYVAYSREKS